ncbi:low temperature requirement protein A [Rhodococcus sp. SJ-3]|uniref:low temperature requirement protein A n=1 Tax=Rhodococcus sp. SJ-3 TaxID=3454628 RepID=UPI003F792CF4
MPEGSFLGLRRMVPRRRDEEHRVATPLELFFDLVFVVAVSFASAQLHQSETSQHIVSGVGAYLMVFFAIWWAWVNFTWFASAFDTDDWLYRVLTLLQMGGVLVLAAGTVPAMTDGDFALVTLGYVMMRLALVPQWLRAARSDPALRQTAMRYAIGITLVQILWVLRLGLPEGWGTVSFLVLVVAELSVPVVAEHARITPWHPEHIAERYSLFTLIVLGESILASANAIVDAIDHTENVGSLVLIAVCGLALAGGMWWVYFHTEHSRMLTGMSSALVFGYGHYVVFAAAGAFSAGIEVAIDHDTHATGLEATAAAATLTVPVAIFLLSAWFLTMRGCLSRGADVAVVGLSLLIGASALAPASLLVAAVLMVVLVAVLVVTSSGALPADAHTGTPASEG